MRRGIAASSNPGTVPSKTTGGEENLERWALHVERVPPVTSALSKRFILLKFVFHNFFNP